jgi:hypothetical protein
MPLRPKLRYTPTMGTLGICLCSTNGRMPSDRTSLRLDASLAILTCVLRFEASGALRPQTGQTSSPNRSGRFWPDSHARSSASALWLSRVTRWFSGEPPQTPRTWCSLRQSPLMTWLPRSPGSTLVLSLNQETVRWLYLSVLATMQPAVDPARHRVPRMKPTCLLHTWRPHRQRPFALVLHLQQHESNRNLHLQYLAKNQSTQRCQSLITSWSDHPPVLKPHMVLNLPLDECIENTHLVIREKEKEKKRIKRNSNKWSKAEKGKEQDLLKKTCLGPLRQGQRLDTSETKPCSSKECKPPKQTRAPPAHMQTPPEQVPTQDTNRSGWFPKPVGPVSQKPVRPVPKTGQVDFVQQTTPTKSQKCKRNAQAPPWLLG